MRITEWRPTHCEERYRLGVATTSSWLGVIVWILLMASIACFGQRSTGFWPMHWEKHRRRPLPFTY